MMKNKKKLNKIQKDLDEMNEKNSEIRKEKIKQKYDLIILVTMAIFIVIYFITSQNDFNVYIKCFLDFTIFSFVFFIAGKEIYVELIENIDKSNKHYKLYFIGTILFTFIVYAIFIYLSIIKKYLL
ncbi:MAG: hypothetical protein RR594_04495 [Clostridia bacterium]